MSIYVGCQRICPTAGESGGWGRGFGVRGLELEGWGQVDYTTQTPDPNLPHPSASIPPTPNLRSQPPDPNLSPLCGESSTSTLLQTVARRLCSNSQSHSYVSPVVWRIFGGESSGNHLCVNLCSLYQYESISRLLFLAEAKVTVRDCNICLFGLFYYIFMLP